MRARSIVRKPKKSLIRDESGGFASFTKDTKGKKYIGPAWITGALQDIYD